jgi:ATP-binding cassette subfamily C protein
VPAAQSRIALALARCRSAFAAIGVFSGVLSLLMLTGSFFMLQVYDRVLPSRSVPTLLALGAVVVLLYVFQGLLDFVRSRLLVRIGRSVDGELNAAVCATVLLLPLTSRSVGDGLQPLRDLDQIRGFLSGPGPSALFDLPWMPIYLAICFAFHFWIGAAALAGAVVLVVITLLTEILTRGPARQAGVAGASRLAIVAAGRRNFEALQAMGMRRRFVARWSRSHDEYMDAQQRSADVGGGLGALSRILRMLLQSAVLAIGAYLVIQQEATAGIIIASSILTSRALAPVELAIAYWKYFVAARQGWVRLNELLSRMDGGEAPMTLPAPAKSIAVEAVSVAPPGEARLVVRDVSFRLAAGQALGVIGPSASGKSSLARCLVGVWRPTRGKVRLDGGALEQWSSEDLGRHIGYLPQDVELFDGTVAENIARFADPPDPDAVVAAARAAQVHDLILRLPDGYGTALGDGGATLSAGQRQRIALARALYGDPFLVVLDEPNSNLDAEGDNALTQAMLGVRARGGIVIVVAHRPAALIATDSVLALFDGQTQAFGPKDEVLRKVLRPAPTPAPMPLKVVSESQGPVP